MVCRWSMVTRDELSEVIHNLIDNAIKYGAKGLNRGAHFDGARRRPEIPPRFGACSDH